MLRRSPGAFCRCSAQYSPILRILPLGQVGEPRTWRYANGDLAPWQRGNVTSRKTSRGTSLSKDPKTPQAVTSVSKCRMDERMTQYKRRVAPFCHVVLVAALVERNHRLNPCFASSTPDEITDKDNSTQANLTKDCHIFCNLMVVLMVFNFWGWLDSDRGLFIKWSSTIILSSSVKPACTR